MKASQLQLAELIDFSEGYIGLKGRRLVLHSMHAFASLRKDLFEMVGPDQSRRIFTRFGYYWGQADAAAMKRIFTWDDPIEWLKAGPRLHTLQGVVRVQVKSIEVDPAGPRARIELVWRDSGEAEEHLDVLGVSQGSVCWMLEGYMSGYASFCLNRDVYFIEDKCRGKGDPVCTAVGMDVASWGPALAERLPYFEKEDIQGKILALTAELRTKTRELERERERINDLQPAAGAVQEVHSKSYARVADLASRVARFDASVLITGETGTGKEVLARAIHRMSKRASNRFVAVNCGALPETLLESELFGHKAGAFTGAVEDREGLFETAEKGTVFLDEIGDTTPATQTKLLRVLEELEIVRVGESLPRKIDVRIIAATNRNLDEDVRAGKFREDLLYRLRVVEIDVPPLRERQEDILPLARLFVKSASARFEIPHLRLDALCADYLLEYAWPGNVRELENAIERAAVLSRDGVIRPENLPPRIVREAENVGPAAVGSNRTLADVESDHIRGVMRLTGGNRTRAAQILAISTTTLWRKLKEHGA